MLNSSIDAWIQPLYIAINWLPAKIICYKFHHSVNEISQIIQEFRVVLQHKVWPAEAAVLRLGPHIQQIETIDISLYACLSCFIAKDTYTSTFRELSIFIIQIFYTWRRIEITTCKVNGEVIEYLAPISSRFISSLNVQ